MWAEQTDVFKLSNGVKDGPAKQSASRKMIILHIMHSAFRTCILCLLLIKVHCSISLALIYEPHRMIQEFFLKRAFFFIIPHYLFHTCCGEIRPCHKKVEEKCVERLQKDDSLIHCRCELSSFHFI